MKGDNEYLQFKYNIFDILGNCCPDVSLRPHNTQFGRVNASIGASGDPARNCFSYSGNEQILTTGNTISFDYWQPFQEMGPFCYFTTNNLSTGGTNNYYIESTTYIDENKCDQSGSILPEDADSLYLELLSVISELDSLTSSENPSTALEDSIRSLNIQIMSIEQKLTGIWWEERKINSLVSLYDNEGYHPRPKQLYGVYLAFGEFNLAQQALDSFITENPSDVAFKAVQDINLKYISSSGENSPDSTELFFLHSIATDTFPSSFYAMGLVEKFTDHIYSPESQDSCIIDGARIVQEIDKEEDEDLKGFVLRPNPAGTDVVIDFKNTEALIQSIVIQDMNGRIVHQRSGQLYSGSNIDISFLPNGIYIFTAILENGTQSTQKLIIL